MQLRRVALLVAIAATSLTLTGCDWSATVRKKAGQPAEGEITVKGSFPAAMKSLRMASAAISAADLYIETAGTDFALDSTGNVAITLSDGSGGIITSASFSWVKSGTKLVFRNPSAVQSWLNSYPSATDVSTKITYGNTPADGVDHFISTAVVYQGAQRASSSATVAAECWSRIHTRMLCMQ